MFDRTDDENLMIVSTAEEYAFLHGMKMPDVCLKGLKELRFAMPEEELIRICNDADIGETHKVEFYE